jgi:hypothetical protein
METSFKNLPKVTKTFTEEEFKAFTEEGKAFMKKYKDWGVSISWRKQPFEIKNPKPRK